jgi:hypothetical protein
MADWYKSRSDFGRLARHDLLPLQAPNRANESGYRHIVEYNKITALLGVFA